MLNKTIYLTLTGFIFVFPVVAAEKTAKPTPEKDLQSYELPKSTMDALERRLQTEKRPGFRVDLLLRWIKSKEEYEQVQLARQKTIDEKALQTEEFELKPGAELSPKMKLYTGFKKEIIGRLQAEIESLEVVPNLNLILLYRELAFRLLELHNFQESILVFDRVKPLTTADWMGLGDAYFSTNQTVRALEAYEKGAQDPRYKGVSAYKRAWCYLRLNQPKQSLEFFGQAIEGTDTGSSRLREEAFKDRIRPYVESFTKPEFDIADYESFKNLAKKVHSKDPAKAKDLLTLGLKILVDSFNSKAQIEKARQVFEFYKKESSDAAAVLVAAAPLWIKVYRGALNHAGVDQILNDLPDKPIQKLDTTILQGEIYNSVVYYDTLFKEEQRALKDDETNPIRPLLLKVNKKFFQLFPEDVNADPLRIGYAKLLLEDGATAECLRILSKRKGTDKEVVDLALSYEAKCELKQLDQLYPLGATPFFIDRLNYNLLDKKTYERTDLGLSSDQAFETLARMLIGALKQNPESKELRASLSRLLDDYTRNKSDKLFYDLQLLQSELKFVDVSKSNLSPEEKADKFYEIYEVSPQTSEINKKSLINSIQLSLNKKVIDRCRTFQKLHAKDFKPGQEVFDRCVRLADRYFDLESEYAFWIPSESLLDENQKLKLGFLELALNKPIGMKRLASLKSPAAKKTLDFWVDLDKPIVKVDNKLFSKLEDEVGEFNNSLVQISFSKIEKIVPAKISAFEKIDGDLIKFYKSKPLPVFLAKTLELRAQMAIKMRDWMKNLPTPPKLDPQELELYKQKTDLVLKPWEVAAESRQKECGELAHTLALEFKVKDLQACPMIVPEEVQKKILETWESSRQQTPNSAPWKEAELNAKTQTAQRLLEHAAQEKEVLKVRYHLMRVLDLAESNYERSRAYLGLAKLTNKPEFWEAAASLDGNLIEAVEWKRSQAEGNPFYAGILDIELQKIK